MHAVLIQTILHEAQLTGRRDESALGCTEQDESSIVWAIVEDFFCLMHPNFTSEIINQSGRGLPVKTLQATDIAESHKYVSFTSLLTSARRFLMRCSGQDRESHSNETVFKLEGCLNLDH